ncbi:MAG: peptide chain release factor N(5)-glutamine methyltransferase [Dehalococcoidia bacterium]|nr:peptide chain release factor N(5)-glutamine methyltransferase [Dehalococcoidia bacterium]
MRLKDALGYIQNCLAIANINEAALEAELLLRHALGYSTLELFLNHGLEISDKEYRSLQALLERRLSGEPLAYITGQREFYKLDFIVNSNVLIPRPESEHLVDKALELAHSVPTPIIADIGTGSGAIAIALAVNLSNSKIYAVDISPEALGVARANAARHAVASRINFIHGNLLDSVPEAVDILVANLPYVKSDDCINSPEPHMALDGGDEGLDVIERLCTALPNKLHPEGSVLLEIGSGQAVNVVRMLQSSLSAAHIETIKDLAGIERVVWGQL